ncbi:MAG: GAF domain-containing protein [Candidatus Zhuqueibacterota bacterium]
MKCIYWEATELQRVTKAKTLYNNLQRIIELKLREAYDGDSTSIRKPARDKEFPALFSQPINSSNRFQEFLSVILKNYNYRFVIVLNRLQLLPKYVTRGILSSLREIYNSREVKKEFTRLNVIISGSSNLLEFTNDENSPFNISHPLLLGPLTRDEAQSKLNAYSEHEIYCTMKAREYLLKEFNNHPYFISNISPVIFKYVHGKDEHAVTLDHARRYLNDFIRDQVQNLSDRYLKEMVVRVKDDIDIYEAILELLNSGKVNHQEPERGVSKYTLSGAMVKNKRMLEFTNNVVKRFLKLYFNDLTKGDIYLKFSQWEKALDHYKKHKANPDRRTKILELKRIEESITSLITLINKCMESVKVWEYFVDSLYYIIGFDSVEIFELKVRDHTKVMRLTRRHCRNPRHGKYLTITSRSENLARYALESNKYVLSFNGREAAFPTRSWDEKRKWIVLFDMINTRKEIQEDLCKIIEHFLVITTSVIDRLYSNFDMFDMLGEEVSIIDRDYNMLYMNKARRDKFDAEIDVSKEMKCYHKLAGRKLLAEGENGSDAGVCPECPAKEVFEESEKTSRMALRRPQSFCCEIANNKEYYLLQTSLTMRDEYGKFTRAINISRDVTKIKRANDLIDDIINIQQHENLDELFQLVLKNISLMGYDRVRFYEYFLEKQGDAKLVLNHYYGMGERTYLNRFVLDLNSMGVLREAFDNKNLVVCRVRKSDFPERSWGWIQTLELENLDVLFAPIYNNNRPFGLLSIDNKTSHVRFEEEDKRTINNIARYIMSAVQNILFSKNQKILFQITSELHNHTMLKTLLPRICESILMQFNVRTCAIFLFNKYRNHLGAYSTKIMLDGKITTININEHYVPGEAITGKVYAHGRPVIINDLANYPGDIRDDYKAKTEKHIKEKIKNCLFVPIISESKILGIIRIVNKLNANKKLSSIGFKEDEQELLENIGKQVGLAVSKLQEAQANVWQSNIISSTLRAIQGIETKFLGQFNLDEVEESHIHYMFEKIYFIILTGLTMKSPYGYNRAAIFRFENNQLVCKRGIGPKNEETGFNLYSRKIWDNIMDEENSSPYDELFEKISSNFDDFKDFYGSNDPNDKSVFLSEDFNRFVKKITLTPDDEIRKFYHSLKENKNEFLSENGEDYKGDSSHFLSKIKAYNWLVCPLIVENEPAGLIFVDNRYNHRPILENDIHMLKQFLDRISVTLGKLEALKKQMRQARSQASLFKIMETLTSKLKMEENVQIIQSELRRIMPAISGICLLQKTDAGYVPISTCLNKAKANCERCERTDRDCLKGKEEYYCEKKGDDPCFRNAGGNFISRYLAVLAYNQEELGILDVDSHLEKAFDQDDLRILKSVANYLSIEIMEARITKDREEIIKEKEQSFNEIAHQMKTPLINVERLSRNFINFELTEEEKKRSLNTIASEAKKALNFTKQILDLNYLAYSNKQFDLVMKPVARIVRESINNNRPIADDKNIEIKVDGLSENIYAEVNEENLIKALSNIINNAVKYSKNESKIQLAVKEVNKEIQFMVQDHGVGIPEKELPRIFDKHERGAYAKEVLIEGIGIGLAITKLIVDKHQGRIKVESKIGEGSTFTIIIPKEKERRNA